MAGVWRYNCGLAGFGRAGSRPSLDQAQAGQLLHRLKLSRREIEGDTANPGTAGPSGSSGRNAGSAPEHGEHDVPGDGWPFRVSGNSHDEVSHGQS